MHWRVNQALEPILVMEAPLLSLTTQVRCLALEFFLPILTLISAVKPKQKSSKRGVSAPKAAVTVTTQTPSAAEIAALMEQNRLPDLALRFRRPATSADRGGGEEEERGSLGDNAGEDVEMGGTEDVDVVGR